jgi:hypothetical protein
MLPSVKNKQKQILSDFKIENGLIAKLFAWYKSDSKNTFWIITCAIYEFLLLNTQYLIAYVLLLEKSKLHPTCVYNLKHHENGEEQNNKLIAKRNS